MATNDPPQRRPRRRNNAAVVARLIGLTSLLPEICVTMGRCALASVSAVSFPGSNRAPDHRGIPQITIRFLHHDADPRPDGETDAVAHLLAHPGEPLDVDVPSLVAPHLVHREFQVDVGDGTERVERVRREVGGVDGQDDGPARGGEAAEEGDDFEGGLAVLVVGDQRFGTSGRCPGWRRRCRRGRRRRPTSSSRPWSRSRRFSRLPSLVVPPTAPWRKRRRS